MTSADDPERAPRGADGIDPTDVDEPTRPTWMGGAGYSPVPESLAPHAPLPGAPPYPAAEAPDPTPVGRRDPGTGPLRALLATVVWVGVELVLRSLSTPPSPRDVLALAPGMLLVVVVTAAPLWLTARPRRRPLWLLALVAGPLYWVLRTFVVGVLGL